MALWDESSADPAWTALNTALGTMLVAASQLEHTVLNVTQWMLGITHPQRTGLVLQGFSAAQMRERCERLSYQVLGGSLQDDMIAWLRRVEEVQRERNRIVHSDWASVLLTEEGAPPLGPAAISRSVTAKRGLETRVTSHTPEDVRALAGRCTKAMIDGVTLQEELQVFGVAERQLNADLSPWVRAPSRA